MITITWMVARAVSLVQCLSNVDHLFAVFALQTHLPGYVADFAKFKSKGVDTIVCTSVVR